MGALLIKLAGPLQSWGAESRFTTRKTRHEPTKSGVVGLIASALGRKRTDSIDDLAKLQIAVRVDQKGTYESDFQTAHLRKFDKSAQRWVSGDSLPLSRRHYLADAVFVVAISAPDEVLDEYSEALIHPAFPLYLGRRSCPPAGKVFIGAEKGVDMMDALRRCPWSATNGRLKRSHCGDSTVELEVLRDSLPQESDEVLCEMVRDVPQCFSPEHRRYTWRTVVRDAITVDNPFVIAVSAAHDPLALLEEAD